MNQLNETMRLLRVQIEAEKLKKNPDPERIQEMESRLSEYVEKVK